MTTMTMMLTTRMRRRAHTRPAVTAGAAAAALLIATAACGAGDGTEQEMGGAAADGNETAAATDATERPAPQILSPVEGAELGGPVRVVLGAENVEIVPAGEEQPNSGHHHLFLNAEPVAEGEVIPADVDGIVHLGQAQTEYSFGELPPGEYTLIALIGDHLHRAIPQSADTVNFRVVEVEASSSD